MIIEQVQEQILQDPDHFIQDFGANYQSYDEHFKTEFIMLKNRIGFTLACAAKRVNQSTASKWVQKVNDPGFEALRDQRSMNGHRGNEALDQYIFGKLIERRTKGLPFSMLIIKLIALNSP